MKFPGTTEIKMTHQAVMEMLQTDLQKLSPGVRVTGLTTSYRYIEFDITTDPEPLNNEERYNEAVKLVAMWNPASKEFNAVSPTEKAAVSPISFSDDCPF